MVRRSVSRVLIVFFLISVLTVSATIPASAISQQSETRSPNEISSRLNISSRPVHPVLSNALVRFFIKLIKNACKSGGRCRAVVIWVIKTAKSISGYFWTVLLLPVLKGLLVELGIECLLVHHLR